MYFFGILYMSLVVSCRVVVSYSASPYYGRMYMYAPSAVGPTRGPRISPPRTERSAAGASRPVQGGKEGGREGGWVAVEETSGSSVIF